MPDIVVTAGVDLPALSRDMAQAQQIMRGAFADVARIQAIIPPPRIDASAWGTAGNLAGRALMDGLARQAVQADSVLAALEGDLRTLATLAADVRLGGADADAAAGIRALAGEYREAAARIEGANAAVAALDASLGAMSDFTLSGSEALAQVEQVLTELQATAARGIAAPVLATAQAGAQAGAIAAANQAFAASAAETAPALAAEAARIDKIVTTVEQMAAEIDASSGRQVAAFRAAARGAGEYLTSISADEQALGRLAEAQLAVSTRATESAAQAAAAGGRGAAAAADEIERSGIRGARSITSIAFGLQAMATATNESESGLRRVLRGVSSLAFAAGPEFGIVASAATATGLAIYDMVNRASTAEEAFRAFSKQASPAEAAARLYADALRQVSAYASDATAQVHNLTTAQAAQRQLSLTAQLQDMQKQAGDLRGQLLKELDPDSFRAAFGSLLQPVSTNAFNMEGLRGQLREARGDFDAGRITAAQFQQEIVAVGNRYPELATLADQFSMMAGGITRATDQADALTRALRGVPQTVRQPGQPFITALAPQIADQQAINAALRSGGVAAKDATAIAVQGFNAWQEARKGQLDSDLRFSAALHSSNIEVHDAAAAYLRDGTALAQLTKGTQIAREGLTAFERQMATFRANAAASAVRVQVAVELGDDTGTQTRLLADLHDQYDAVAAAAARAGAATRGIRSDVAAKNTLELLRQQLALARQIDEQLTGAASRAGQRLTLAPQFGGDQTALAARLDDAYAAVAARVAEQGGFQRANLALVQEQIRAADQLGARYTALLAPRPDALGTLVAPLNPAVEASLRDARSALDDLVRAQGQVRLDTLRPTGVEQAVADLRAVDLATTTLAQQQGVLADALAHAGLSAQQQRGILDALEGRYRDAGVSIDALRDQLAAPFGGAPSIRLQTAPVLPPMAVTVDHFIITTTPSIPLHVDRIDLTGPATAGLRTGVEAALQQAQAAANTLRAAQGGLDLSQLFGGGADQRAAQQVFDLATQGAREAGAAALALIRNLPGPAQIAAAERLHQILATLKPDPRIHDLAGTLEAASTGVRGVLQIADAFGAVDQATHRALDGVTGLLSGLAEASKALDAIKKAGGSGGVGSLFTSLAGISSVVGIAGGLASLGGALFASHPDPILRQNTDALERLTESLNTSAKSGGGLAAAEAALRQIQGHGFLSGADLQQYLTGHGIQISFKDIEAVARANGSELFSGGGLVLPQTIDTLIQQFDLLGAKITAFGDTLSEQRARADLAAKLYDDPNATAQQQAIAKLNEELQLLDSLAPKLGGAFQGLDATTTAGRAAILDGLRHLFDTIGHGLTADDLGKLAGIDDLTSIIGNADDALNSLAKSADDVAGALGNLPQAFKRDLAALAFGATAVGLPPIATPVPSSVPASAGRTDPTGGSIVAPIIVQKVEIHTAEVDGRKILAELSTEVRQQALAAGGAGIAAARGLMPALLRIR